MSELISERDNNIRYIILRWITFNDVTGCHPLLFPNLSCLTEAGIMHRHILFPLKSNLIQPPGDSDTQRFPACIAVIRCGKHCLPALYCHPKDLDYTDCFYNLPGRKRTLYKSVISD